MNRQERLYVLNHKMFFDHFAIEISRGRIVGYGPRKGYKNSFSDARIGEITIAAIACEAPSACVGDPDAGKLTTYYGLAFCAPGDCFSRARGRLEAKRALHVGLHHNGAEDWKLITHHPMAKRRLFSGSVANEQLPLAPQHTRTEWLRLVLRQFSIECTHAPNTMSTSSSKKMPPWYGMALMHAARKIVFDSPSNAYTIVGQLVQVFERLWRPSRGEAQQH